MSVGVQVGSIIDEVGAASFFNAFFSTIAAVLEDGDRGSRFPVVSGEFYQGHVPAERTTAALQELHAIRAELESHSPDALVWDLDDLDAQPPWGDNISADITHLGNYFFTSTGRDLFDLLIEAFEAARDEELPVDIV